MKNINNTLTTFALIAGLNISAHASCSNNIDMGNKRINNVADPVTAKDVVNLQYFEGNQPALGNSASGFGAVVGGGQNNAASEFRAVVSGGGFNTASGIDAVVSGGNNNIASGNRSTVSGGFINIASGSYATVSGGFSNIASGSYATVVGGYDCNASEMNTVVIGKTLHSRHVGSWVIGDSNPDAIAKDFRDSGNSDRFYAFFKNGYYLNTTGNAADGLGVTLGTGATAWSSISDKNKKENYKIVAKQDILNKLVAMPIEEWNYIAQDDNIRHIGPYAQDFNAAYGLGDGELTISTLDADGIALVSVQALAERNKQLEEKVNQLETRLLQLEVLLKQ